MKKQHLLVSALLVVFVLTGFVTTKNPKTTQQDTPMNTQADPVTWTVDAVHSKIGFKVKHLGISTVRGQFKEYEAAVSFDPADLSTFQTEATIQTASIDTENERRDGHLKSDDFFNAEAFPAMTFKSKGVRNVDDESFELVGDLTIRDVTKEIVLEVEYAGTATMRDQTRAGFEAEGVINRLDYGLAWNNVTEAGGIVVGHNVTIVLEMELIKK